MQPEVRGMRLGGPRIPNDRPDLVIGSQCPILTFGRQRKCCKGERPDIWRSRWPQAQGVRADIAGICELGISNEDTVMPEVMGTPLVLMA